MAETGLSNVAKMQPVLIIAAALVGVVLGQSAFVADNAKGLIEPFLMVLLFMIFLKIDIKDIGRSFRNIRFTATSLIINFLWTPVFAVILGHLFLGGSADLQIGFLMLLVTPCTDWYLVFTGISKGNVSLSASILPLNLVLQILLLPVYLLLFMGTSSSFDIGSMLVNIVMVLAVPFFAANAVKLILDRSSVRERYRKAVETSGDDIQLAFLCLAVVSMFASQGGMIIDNPVIVLEMLIPLIIFFIVNFAIAQISGRCMGFPFDDTTSLTFTTLARNSPLALAIAVAAFPDSPLIALVLVIGPLIELPVLSVVSSAILRMRMKQQTVSDVP